MKFTRRLRHWITGKNLQRGFIGAGHGGGSLPYQIANSVRLRAAASASFSRTPGVAGNSKLLCGRFRIKRGTLGALQVIASAGTSSIDRFYFDSSDRLCLDVLGTTRLVTTAVYRDPSAHYVDVGFQLDVANGTAALRAKILINGTEVGSYSTDTRSSITNTNTNWNAAVVHYIGKDNAGNYFDGVLSEPSLVDGSTSVAYSTTDTNGVPIPSQPSATWGTCGSYLKFNDGTSATTLGYDRSGNGNNWTASGISTTAGVTYDWLTDTPTNNYCVLNAVANFAGSTLSDGNLKLTPAGAGYYCNAATFTVSSGKWYWEMTASGPNWNATGVAKVGSSDITTSGRFLGQASDAWSAFVENASTPLKKYNNGSATAFSPAIGPVAAGDIIQVALDADNGKIFFGYNGTWCDSSDPAAGTNPAFYGLTGPFTLAASASTVSKPLNLNLGQGALTSGASYYSAAGGTFKYSPPTGFKAPCTANLPAVAVPNPSLAIAHRYEAGSGIAANIASDRGSWASWIEIFKRGDTSESWKVRFSTDTSNMWAFDSNAAKAAWSAPSAGTYLGVALRVGSIYGIDTGTYSGNGSASQDVSHSLGAVPTAAIIKDESTGSVYFWHSKMTGATYFTIFNSATPPAQSNTNTPFGGSGWLSSTFGVTNNATNNLNASSHTYRYILFSDVSGLLRMLGFTGNGSTDGAFEYAGQRPQIQIEKDLAATTGIYLFSDMIDTYNVTASYLLMNSSAAVAAATGVDIVANGIKHRSATVVNAANSHAAISLSRQPFGGSNVSPACAR